MECITTRLGENVTETVHDGIVRPIRDLVRLSKESGESLFLHSMLPLVFSFDKAGDYWEVILEMPKKKNAVMPHFRIFHETVKKIAREHDVGVFQNGTEEEDCDIWIRIC